MKIFYAITKPLRALGDGNALKVTGYLVFFLAALMVFVYARFPSDALIPLIEKNALPAPYKLKISALDLTFPPALSLADVTVIRSSPETNSELMFFPAITIQPSIVDALTGGYGARVTARLFGGETLIDIFSPDGDGNNLALEFTIDGVNAGRMPLWKDFAWGELDGLLGGDGNFAMTDGDFLKGSGALNANLAGALFHPGKIVGSGVGDIEFSEGIARLSYKNGRVTIKKMTLTGPEVEISINGNVIVGRDPSFSRLSLTINLKFQGSLKKKLGPLLAFFRKSADGSTVIRLGGTVKSPAVH